MAMVLAVGLQLQMFHPFHRVAILFIGKFTISVSSGDLINGALNTELGLKTSGQQFAGILAVGAWVVGFAHHDLGTSALLHPLGNLKDFQIFKTGVVAARWQLWMGEKVAIHIGHILNMDVGPGLLTAKYCDFAIFEPLVGEHVHAHIQPHAW